jgi:anti-repressor protein
MNELKIFENPAFGKVRVVEQGGEPWFVGKDVAQALGYSNPRKALADHVRENHKSDGVTIRDTIGREQHPTIIDEAGLYSLVMRAKTDKAEDFQEWVTAEVLPAIRKTGGYIAGSEKMSDAELMAKAVLVAQATIKERDARIKELESDTQRMKPKEIFADAVSASDQTILIGDLAKLIKQNGHDIGQKRMFEWLRNNGYLIKRQGADYNSPTQRAMELGLFRIKETAVTHSDGHVTISKTVKVTGKGQAYFVNKLLGAKGA